MSDNRTIGFRRHLQVYVLDGSRVMLRDQAETRVLTDPAYTILAPLLDGTRTEDEIVAGLAGDFPAEKLYYALLTLQSKGHVVELDDRLPARETAYWHASGLEVSEILARRRLRTVALCAPAEPPGLDVFTALLEENGLVITGPDDASLVLVLTDDYLKLDAVIESPLSAGKPWLPVRLDHGEAWIGPLFNDGARQWQYLRRRLEQNLHAALMRSAADSREVFRPDSPAIGSGYGLAPRFAATEVTRQVLTDRNDLLDRLVIFDAVSNRASDHPVPGTEVLARLSGRFDSIRTEQEPSLVSREKLYARDGGWRSERPGATLAAIQPFVSPLTGIVPEVMRLHGNDAIHVFVTRQPVAGSGVMAMGKGATETQSHVSCCAEALERYCAHFHGDEPRRLARLDNLGDDAVHPGSVLQFSESQYRSREAWNREHQGYNWVPERFDESVAIEWTPAWSLSRGGRRWVPTAYCYYGYRIPSGPRFCRGDSNGCAAGNNREEAILQGLLELVERDAAGLWWYNRARRPRVDLAACCGAFADDVAHFHDAMGREVYALDITTDLGIPVIVAISWRREDGGGVELALGAHLDVSLAVSRALSELSQLRLAASGDGDGKVNFSARHEHETWLNQATIYNQDFLRPLDERAIRPGGHEYTPNTDLRDDIQLVLDRLHRCGLEALVLDQTRADCPLSVVRAIVPGLRHFWARYAPGRLYDIPVALGWQSAPTAEAELNPIPLFI